MSRRSVDPRGLSWSPGPRGASGETGAEADEADNCGGGDAQLRKWV